MRPWLSALTVAVMLCSAAAADPKPYSDPARGFSTMIPEGWSDFAGGTTTYSADRSVSCTITVTPHPASAQMSQADINLSLQAYTADVWRAQFFQGGATGTIEQAGITKLDAFDAPYAKGQITYPGRALAKFTVLLVQGPGKIVSGTCTGEPSGYNKHENIYGVGKVLNYMRPL